MFASLLTIGESAIKEIDMHNPWIDGSFEYTSDDESETEENIKTSMQAYIHCWASAVIKQAEELLEQEKELTDDQETNLKVAKQMMSSQDTTPKNDPDIPGDGVDAASATPAKSQ